MQNKKGVKQRNSVVFIIMAYSAQSVNDYVLFNNNQNENPNQLDSIYFCDFVQQASPTSSGPGTDGSPFSFTTVSTTINRSAAQSTAYGITAGHGLINIATTALVGGLAVLESNSASIPGLTAPSSGLITKYECETSFLFQNIYTPDESYGYVRFGFMNSATTPADGVYFQFWVNGVLDPIEGYYIDDSPLNTTWNIVWEKDDNFSSFDTGITVSSNKIYQLYLGIEVNSSGNFTTTYKVVNKTDGTSASGTASPSSNTHYPSGITDYMKPSWINSSIGNGINDDGLFPTFVMDYIGARIRRPLNREILLFS